MKVRFHLTLICALSAVAAFAGASPAAANDHSPPMTGIIAAVRHATNQYRDVAVAETNGYTSLGSCVSGDQEGAMGVHYAKFDLIGDGAVDVQHPELLVYEPGWNGQMRLVAVEYITIASEWDGTHAPGVTPVLMGQLFHYHASPNRYGLPAFYALHVWAWKNNPKGAFAAWNPNVSCVPYTGS